MNLERIKMAADILRNGGIVVYPTETVYGIGCDPLNRKTCEQVQRLKKRNEPKPFILLADSLEAVEDFAGLLDSVSGRLAKVFWPGPLTMVIKPVKALPGHLFGPSGGVAFRVTSHPVAAALSCEFGQPVISTSANITGKQPVVTFEDAVKTFGKLTGIILKNTELLYNQSSTVIDLTAPTLQFLRTGAISLEQIQKVL